MQLDLGFCWAFPDTPPEPGLRFLKTCGFEGIELWPDDLWRFGPESWAAALQRTGMRCFQLCPYFDFVSGGDCLERSRAQLRDFLEAADALECSRLRTFTGPPWGKGIVGSRDATGEQWQNAIAGLREFCNQAAERQIELCLECHEGSLMDDSEGALSLLHGVGRPNLTVNLQLPLWREDWSVSVRRLASWTRHIHLHNWAKGLGEEPLTYLSEGAFDWYPVLKQLRDQGCPGICLSVEHATHHGRHSAEQTAKRDGPYLRRLRERLQSPPRTFPLMSQRPWSEDHLTPYTSLHAADVRLLQVDATPSVDPHHPEMAAWLDPQTFDYSRQEALWRRLLNACPDSQLCLRLYIASPTWWDEAHPEELQRFHDGSCRHRYQRMTRQTLPSLASEVWKSDADKCIRHFLNWLHQSEWRDKVWGFVIGYGITWEWGILGSDGFVDYSIPMRNRFREWLKDRYSCADELRTAWGMHDVNFENAEIPSKDARLQADSDFRVFPRDRASFDFQNCLSDANADLLIAFGRAIRRHSVNRYTLGAFYGYTLTAREQNAFTGCYGAGGLHGGHHAYARFLAAGVFDFNCSPFAYSNRELGEGLLHPHFPPASTQYHGVRIYDENDLRPYTMAGKSDDRAVSIGQTHSLADSIQHQRLAIAQTLARESSSWWAELSGWIDSYAAFYDRPLIDELARHVAMSRHRVGQPRRSLAEIALIVDERSIAALGLNSKLFLTEIYQQLSKWAWVSAPFDTWLLSDICRQNMDAYKLCYVFAPYLRPAERTRIRTALANDQRTIWWGPWTGAFTDHGLDEPVFQSLTGFSNPADTRSLRRLNQPEWISLYGSCAGQSLDELIGIVESAGVQRYAQTPIHVVASESLIQIHVKKAADYLLNLPPYLWVDLMSDRCSTTPKWTFPENGVALLERQ